MPQHGQTDRTALPLRRAAALLTVILVGACSQAGRAPARVVQAFDAAGITKVVLRASAADAATTEPASNGTVTVSGRPIGGAEGYHPADPKWRETPAAEWGLDFVGQRFGATLVISTKNEIGFIHHHYTIADIDLKLPASVTLVRQVRTLSGDGAADLAPP